MKNKESLDNSYQRNYNSTSYTDAITNKTFSMNNNTANTSALLVSNSTKISDEVECNVSESQPKVYSQITENYINNLKSLFENEKNNLIQKLFNAQKEIEYTKSYMKDKINNYEDQIREIQTRHKVESEEIEKQFNFELKKAISEKEEEIKLLVNKNNELTQCNADLIEKLNKYLDLINTSKISFNNELTTLQCENERLKQENENMKHYYEGKLEYCNKVLTEEKNNLIYSYGASIKELKDGYSLSKENYLKLLEQKEIESKKLYENYEKDNEKLQMLNKEYKEKISSLTEDNINMKKREEEYKFQIENLRKEVEKKKKEASIFYQEKNEFENKYINLSKEHSHLKNKADKLTRITYGKLFKK